jgi:hypothetical protein
MRLAKAESLKKDVEILSQNHERDVDRKDAILQMLDRFDILSLSSLYVHWLYCGYHHLKPISFL